MTTIGYGVDVSAFQASSVIDACAGQVDFVICRAAYGKSQDKRVIEHAARVRAIGAKLGLYVFFRIVQPIDEQWDAFRRVADAVGYKEGDVVPALDIEPDPFDANGQKRAMPAMPSSSWSGRTEDLIDRMVTEYGEAMPYVSRHDWLLLGMPGWVLERPLWVPEYTAAQKVDSPGGMQPTIWQHRVGVFQKNGAGGYDKDHPELDQNRQLLPLPLVGAPKPAITDAERARVEGLIALTAQEITDGAFREERRAG